MLNESIKMALQGMVSNKLRTFLTLLGIIIGVGAVIAMVSLGFGLKENVKNNISKLGSNLLIITSGGRTASGARLAAGEGVKLTYDDMQAIEKQVDGIANISASVNRSYQMVAGNQNWTSRVEGTTPSSFTISSLEVEDGRILSERDLVSRGRVAVIGKTVADSLFPEGNPVGKIMRINKAPFQVIGVLKSKGQGSMGMDQDNLIITPYTTVMKRILAITYLQEIVCSALSEEYTDKAIEEVSSVLRRNHKLKESDDDDFNIRSQQELSTMMTSTSDMMSTLLAAVAGISLLVGGIGIMNIMYVSVTERTKEIGLRMSIGAKGRDILAQFLIEATLISITGGLLGVILGVAASYIVKAVLSYPILIQPWSIIISFLVCTIIGIFFGWYPARKASNLDPIEAIRYE